MLHGFFNWQDNWQHIALSGFVVYTLCMVVITNATLPLVQPAVALWMPFV